MFLISSPNAVFRSKISQMQPLIPLHIFLYIFVEHIRLWSQCSMCRLSNFNMIRVKQIRIWVLIVFIALIFFPLVASRKRISPSSFQKPEQVATSAEDTHRSSDISHSIRPNCNWLRSFSIRSNLFIGLLQASFIYMLDTPIYGTLFWCFQLRRLYVWRYMIISIKKHSRDIIVFCVCFGYWQVTISASNCLIWW